MKVLKNKRISKSEWVSFILTLIATLVGVLIAIWLTNSGIRNKEKKDTIKLLHTAKLILSNTNEYSKKLNETILELEKDTIKYTKNEIESVKTNNPIPYPNLVETIISNELISKNISEYTHNQVYTGLLNMRKLSEYETVEVYLKSLEDMILLLELEMEYLKGEINLHLFESKIETRRKEIDDIYQNENVLKIKPE